MAKRLIVAGALAQHPIGGGGNAWAFLQYILGFRKLGFETYYVEHIATDNCFDEGWQRTSFAQSANVKFFRDIMHEFGFAERSSLLLEGSSEHVGLSLPELEEVAAASELFLNMSGRFHIRSVLDATRRRAYLDMDPGFVQVWQEQYKVDMNLQGHDVHFTVGLNLGTPRCPLPTCGIDWHTTLPPVVLDRWANSGPCGERYTTVADWRGYSAVEWNGRWYGQKSEEFLKLLDLPRRVAAPLEICLAIHPDEVDRSALLDHGWHLSEPRQQVSSVDSYRAYICHSRGELTAVKNGYAAGCTGWVSDRSVCYLAAGRPVIVQDTGIGAHLPLGSGLLTFDSVDGAARAIEQVEADYDRHAAAARELARTHFDSDRVLPRLLAIAGV